MFSPIQHALLNTAKRVTVVLGFFLVTFTTANKVSPANIISAISCIVIIVIGNKHIHDQNDQNDENDEKTTSSKTRPTSMVLVGSIIFLVGSVIFFRSPLHSINSSSLIVRPNITMLWTYHQPLSHQALHRLSTFGSSASLLCATSSCLTSGLTLGIPASRLILPPLCADTPLHPFILHHSFYKIVLERQFPSVLQLATSLCLLYTSPITLINPNMEVDFLSLLHNSSASSPSLYFSRSREVVFGQTVRAHSPEVLDLMAEVMASLDQLPRPIQNNTSVVGVRNLLEISLFETGHHVLDINGDAMVGVEVEFGNINYDGFQRDCRRKREEKTCIVNAGNEMQSVASGQWLPVVAARVDHTNFAGHIASPPHISTTAFGNAWWGKTDWGNFTFPPSSTLHLILVSVHVGKWSLVSSFKGLAWLRRQGSIGARDHGTLQEFRNRNIPSYFSACLTLTLDPRLRLNSRQPRSEVLVIDTVSGGRAALSSLLPPAIMETYKSYTVNLGYTDSKGLHTRPPFHQPFQFAYGNLLEIARAKLVITARIHVALPAVALGTPVIFTFLEGNTDSGLPGGKGGRVKGLNGLFHEAYRNTTTNTWRFHSGKKFDWSNPPENPSPYLRQRLIASLWSRLRGDEAMADNARLFGLFPRPPLPASGEEVEVIEMAGISALLTLRSLESVLFHHPGASVTLVRNMAWRLGRAEEQELLGHLETLQEAGYRVEARDASQTDVTEAKQVGAEESSWSWSWRINSNTILLAQLPDEEKKHIQKLTEEETTLVELQPTNQLEGEKSMYIKYISDPKMCAASNSDFLMSVVAVKINMSLAVLQDWPHESLCRKILNDYCILANIII